MLLIFVVLVMIAVVVSTNVGADGVSSGDLGWMSERWLAEHRASHP